MTSSPVPFDFSTRHEIEEWMDDLSISEAQLTRALRDLRRINRLLGAYRATNTLLDPILKQRDELRIVDLGCGGGDYLCRFVRRGPRFGCRVRAVGIDANAVTVGHARAFLDDRLPGRLRSRARVDVGDALDPDLPSDAFDVAHAALFLHHLHGSAAPALLRQMDRITTNGILVNDLHRHPLAYFGIWGLSRLLRLAPMVQHDGPISVLRGFRRPELTEIASRAALPDPDIQWHWAFRWTLSTLPRFD